MSEHPATDLIVAWWAERFQVAENQMATPIRQSFHGPGGEG